MSTAPLDEQGLPLGYPFKTDYEITPRQARDMLAARSPVVIVDVRTAPELDAASIKGPFVHIPLDEIERRAGEIDADSDTPVLTLCHHGVRSLKAALALRALGHPNTRSIAGGIDLWSLAADANVPRYERSGGVCRVLPPTR